MQCFTAYIITKCHIGHTTTVILKKAITKFVLPVIVLHHKNVPNISIKDYANFRVTCFQTSFSFPVQCLLSEILLQNISV
jgi:hypothetical protein